MPNLNQHAVIGHISADPDIRFSPNGKAICKLTIAVNRGYGEKKVTDWCRCVAFGDNAELIAEHFKKGDAIQVEGPVTTSSWEDSQGQKRYSTETLVNLVSKPLYKKKDKPADKPASQASGQGASSGSAPDKDIPFAPHLW